MTGILDLQTHPDLDTWCKLLDRALSAIAAVERETGARQQIRIGGGTVLSALCSVRFIGEQPGARTLLAATLDAFAQIASPPGGGGGRAAHMAFRQGFGR